jgi:hypothetical protein
MLSAPFDTRNFRLDKPVIDKQTDEWMRKAVLRKKQEEAKRKAEEEERKRIAVSESFHHRPVVSCYHN